MSFSHFMYGMGWFFAVVIPFVALGILVSAIRMIPTWIANHRTRLAGVDKVDSMSGDMFEIWLKHQFSKAGYTVKRTPYQGDHGADLILVKQDGTKIAIQAKQLGGRNARVGAKALGEVLRGKKYYNCDEAMMVTNRDYTQPAKDEARKIGIKLMGRKELVTFAMQVKNTTNRRR